MPETPVSPLPNALPPSPRARRAVLVAATALLGALATGCVSVPPPLQGAWSPLAPREAGAGSIGAAVRWGGRIVAVEAEGERTCFRMIAQPLAENGQPDGGDASLGRFSACRTGRYDPRSFAPNREITVTGRIEGFDAVDGVAGSPGVPRVAAQAVLLWPRRR
jgi:outer membrane lipoprotein